jgi:hypothetical protein
VTGYIPVKYGDTVYIKNITLINSGVNSCAFYNANHEYITGNYFVSYINGGAEVNGEMLSMVIDSTTSSKFNNSIAYMRFSANEITPSSVVTVNQPIEGATEDNPGGTPTDPEPEVPDTPTDDLTNFAGPLTEGRLSNSAIGNISTDSPGTRVTDFVPV